MFCDLKKIMSVQSSDQMNTWTQRKLLDGVGSILVQSST